MGQINNGQSFRQTLKTRVVHCRREPYDVYIGRGRKSIWGNPYREGVHGTREECVELYRVWIKTQPRLLAKIPELKGKTLGCWCRPEKACHGDILADLADASVENHHVA